MDGRQHNYDRGYGDPTKEIFTHAFSSPEQRKNFVANVDKACKLKKHLDIKKTGDNILSSLTNSNGREQSNSVLHQKLNALQTELNTLFDSALSSDNSAQLKNFVEVILPREQSVLRPALNEKNRFLNGASEAKQILDELSSKYKKNKKAARDQLDTLHSTVDGILKYSSVYEFSGGEGRLNLSTRIQSVNDELEILVHSLKRQKTLAQLEQDGATFWQDLQEFRSEAEQKAELKKFNKLCLPAQEISDEKELRIWSGLAGWVSSQKEILCRKLKEKEIEIGYADRKLMPYLGDVNHALKNKEFRSFLPEWDPHGFKTRLDNFADNLDRAYESSNNKQEITQQLITIPTAMIRMTLDGLPAPLKQWFTAKLDALLISEDRFCTQAYQMHELEKTVNSFYLQLSDPDRALVPTACNVFAALNAFSIQPSSVFYSRWKCFCSNLEIGISSDTMALKDLARLTARIEPFQKIVELETRFKALEAEATQIVIGLQANEQSKCAIEQFDTLVSTFNQTVIAQEGDDGYDGYDYDAHDYDDYNQGDEGNTKLITQMEPLVGELGKALETLKQIKQQQQDAQEVLEEVLEEALEETLEKARKAEAAAKARKEQLFTISQNAGPKEWKERSTQMDGFEVEEPPKPAATSASSSWWSSLSSSLWTSRENAPPAATQPTLSSSARKGFSLNG